MPKFKVYGLITGSKYLGIVEAKNKDDAQDKIDAEWFPSVSLCHQCTEQVEDPQIMEFTLETYDGDEPEGEVNE